VAPLARIGKPQRNNLTAAATEVATSHVAVEGYRDVFRGAANAARPAGRDFPSPAAREKVPEADEGK
jgi:hypothetical protein